MELRDELKTYSFRSHTDTEVFLAAYARRGTECLTFLNGMFAFAIWDAKQKQLVAARDRFGEKPFYHFRRPRPIPFCLRNESTLPFRSVSRRTQSQHHLPLSCLPGDRCFRRNFFSRCRRSAACARSSLLPRQQRNDKKGFEVPEGAWLLGPLRRWAEGILNSSELRQRAWIDPAMAQQVWKQFLSRPAKHHSLIFRWLSLESCASVFLHPEIPGWSLGTAAVSTFAPLAAILP